ncbi:MAG: hypothetical protein E6G97_18605 [Alphaproteobacteria bacterium]|nr:MAG: hypothetical protein E6G97_18605 [Alphaproteobacteria bacterium]
MAVQSLDHDPLLALFRRDCERTRAVYLHERAGFLHRTQGGPLEVHLDRPCPWDGGRGPSGKKINSSWPGLVDFAWKNGVDPTDLVAAAFLGCSNQRPPLPDMLKTQAALSAARKYREALLVKLTGRARADLDRLGARLYAQRRAYPLQDGERQLREVLSLASFSPLIAFCAALEAGATNLVRELFDAAFLEYLPSRAEWARVLGDRLPDDFPELADLLSGRLREGWFAPRDKERTDAL